ncbi:MAG: DUF2892 domain-containing protein [Chloroflexota bacterium]|nr:DUF2892 domain-containing protein [Chloroflexota bacterium]
MLYFTGVISGALALVLGVIAVIFLITSLIGFCPPCRLFGISTSKKTSRSRTFSLNGSRISQ